MSLSKRVRPGVEAAPWVVQEIAALEAKVRELEAERDACKLQAQCHAQEARTANATIAEIYQCFTGATGEPGNWIGAEPARKIMAELTASRQQVERLAEVLKNLVALVRGECPSLLDEDSGGNSILSIEIDEVLSTIQQETKEQS